MWTSGKYNVPVYVCLVDLEKADDLLPSDVLLEDGLRGSLLRPARLYIPKARAVFLYSVPQYVRFVFRCLHQGRALSHSDGEEVLHACELMMMCSSWLHRPSITTLTRSAIVLGRPASGW